MTDNNDTPPPTPGRKPKRPMSDARISGMVATGVLLALVVFVTWFVLAAG